MANNVALKLQSSGPHSRGCGPIPITGFTQSLKRQHSGKKAPPQTPKIKGTSEPVTGPSLR